MDTSSLLNYLETWESVRGILLPNPLYFEHRVMNIIHPSTIDRVIDWVCPELNINLNNHDLIRVWKPKSPIEFHHQCTKVANLVLFFQSSSRRYRSNEWESLKDHVSRIIPVIRPFRSLFATELLLFLEQDISPTDLSTKTLDMIESQIKDEREIRKWLERINFNNISRHDPMIPYHIFKKIPDSLGLTPEDYGCY